MKFSFKSKLIARTTPGVSVRSERPMAESARVLIMPPWTKPEWLAMSSVAVISTVAEPSPVSTSSRPSQAHAGDCTLSVISLTALALRDRQARRRGRGHQPAFGVEHVRLPEQQRLLDLHHAPDRPEPALHDRA